MHRRFLLLLLGLSVPALTASTFAVGCSSTTVVEPPGEDAGRDAHHDAHQDGSGGTKPFQDADTHDALDEFNDPGCPDAGPPPTMFMCDPYNQNDGECAPGDGCYIFVEYPQEACGQEIYGASCASAGPGVQGDPCDGPQDCGGGFVCVVSGSGTQCVFLCPLEGESNCPEGLVCEPIDVQGFGGCL